MKEFKLLGVQILENLVDDQDNCTQVKDAKDLIPNIIELTREGRLDCKLDFEIVHSSLKALLKLVKLGRSFGAKCLEICTSWKSSKSC